MNNHELRKILDEHKIYVESFGKNGSKADLSGADLRGADLSGADMSGADMMGANLRCANMSNADLRGADLSGADMSGADMMGADLRYANMMGANLRCADLRYANMMDADLRGADLRYANMSNADLRGANLPDHTYVIMGEKYHITITNGEYLSAGCQNHTIEDWRKFTKREMVEMGGKKALRFYPRLLDIADFYLGKGERPDWLNKPYSER